MLSIDNLFTSRTLVVACALAVAFGVQLASPPALAQLPDATASVVVVSPRVPGPPEQVGAAKAYSVLEKHCARCHQDGRLKDGMPGRGLANILALGEIARDPALVVPGLPDASRLYTSILSRQMPSDVFHGQGGDEPTADEIQTLRDWINDLPPQPIVPGSGKCAGRVPVSSETIAQTIATAVEQAGPERAKQLRFISLAPLYNACATAAELAGFRQGVTHVVNGLSWNVNAAKIEALGEQQVILQLALPDLGWIAAHWEQLAAVYPLRLAPSARLPQPVQDATGTRTPLIAADWFADAAMRPPLYYELLGLPGRFGNLQRILRLDVDNDLRRGLARRAGVVQSGETRGSRVLERHSASTGGLWLSYDLGVGGGRQNLLEHPLGPVAGEGGRTPFRHDGQKVLFPLPNGFPAFSINDARGDRIDRSAAEAEADRPAGGACLQCHRRGPIGVRDEVRTFVENDRTAQRELREAVQALYANEQEYAKLVEADQAKTVAALASVGINADLRIWGLDPVLALAHAWRRRVDLDRAAADFGVEPKVLQQRLAGVTGDNLIAARSLRQGTAPRDEVSLLLLAELALPPALAGDSGPAAAAAGSSAPVIGPTTAIATDRLELAIWSDSDTHVAGQAVTIHAQASQDCNLTVIDVDRSGRATVLFPNEFEQNNRIVAGREQKIPGVDSPYRFRLKERGRETFVAVCSKQAKSPEGVWHDFERLRFTVLGDWQIFLREPPALDEARRDDAATERPGPQRRRPRAKAEPTPARTSGPDVQARTAITVDVK